MEIGERFELRFGGDTYWCYVEATYKQKPEVYPLQAYSQQDSRWGNHKLLHSTYTLGNAGCAVTCAAMILSQGDPDITPLTLNDALLDSHLADNGLLGWESITTLWDWVVYDGPEVRWRDGDLIWHGSSANIERVKAELIKGPLIVEVDYLPGGAYDSHFVVAIEDLEDDILIIDPLDGEQVSLLERYGKPGWGLGRAIYGLRLLRMKESNVGAQTVGGEPPREKAKVTKFWDLFEKNVIISGALAAMMFGVVGYLAVTGQPIPEVIAGLAGTVCGYFFGAGKARAAIQTLKG